MDIYNGYENCDASISIELMSGITISICVNI